MAQKGCAPRIYTMGIWNDEAPIQAGSDGLANMALTRIWQ